MRTDPRTLLQRHFGYTDFRPGQEELVRAVLSGRDALGILPTGGGKSVCYQVPALALGGLTLVVTPLVSLMQDQVRRALDAGLRGAFMSATQTVEARRGALAAARAGELDVLFVAPERLELERFRDELSRLDVRLLAVDEAHCISEWGHEFRPSYRRIGALRAALSCPTLALTATATPDVREDIVTNLGLPDPVVVVRSFDRPNLSWCVRRSETMAERVSETYRMLTRRPGPAIVYAPTRGGVEGVRDRLAAFGVRAQAYHAGLSGAARSSVQDAFMAGECRVVVATNAFGMGIDKADVRTVVHVSLPSTLEAYYQEAGRAGRDGAAAACIAFWSPRDLTVARGLVDVQHPHGRTLRRALRALGRESGAGQGGPFWKGGGRPAAEATGEGPPLAERWAAEGARPVLEALSRVGAVVPGTVDGAEGFHGVWRYRSHLVDLAPLLARRSVVVGKLKAVGAFARTRGCRRRALLRYFGERAPGRCGRCDRCNRHPSI